MISNFRFSPTPVTTIFGLNSTDELIGHLNEIDVNRALFCMTQGAASRYKGLLTSVSGATAGLFAGARPHNPESVANDCLKAFGDTQADGIVAIGGGSTIGLAKYVRVKTGAPALIVPTTYSGSEQTPIYGMKIGDQKRTWVDTACMPDRVIYDPTLTVNLPAHETVTTGMNGLAHCVESLYFGQPGPLVTILARQGIGAFSQGLSGSVRNAENIGARTAALYGGFIGGLVIQMAGIALHHKICHVLGGLFDIPHGESNAVILPYAVAYNAGAAEPAMAIIRDEFGADDAAAALYDFSRSLGAPASLKAIGMPEAGIERAAEATLSSLKVNPRKADLASLATLFDWAYQGKRPMEGAY